MTDPWVFGSIVNPTRRRRLQLKLSFLRDDELEQVQEALWAERDRRGEIEQRREAEIARRTVTSTRVASELVRCGTKGCHCARGSKLHGPYWYAYITLGDGRVRKRYIGAAANAAAALREAEKQNRAIYSSSSASSSSSP
ncbi:MAG TPA: DUF6788 family protein [Casimicrobiaceae bacterium]